MTTLLIQEQALLLLDQEEEINLLNKFVSLNPYPENYDEISSILPLQLDAEYGLSNHEWCRTIYENMSNSRLVNNIINKIVSVGGYAALNANLLVIKNYSPLKNSKNMYIQMYFKKYIWDIYYKK